MKKYLRGLSITNYRGIGLNKQTLSHLSNINLLIGPNNSGKSSFLSFIHQNISNFNIPQNTTQNKRKNSIRKTDIHSFKRKKPRMCGAHKIEFTSSSQSTPLAPACY